MTDAVFRGLVKELEAAQKAYEIAEGRHFECVEIMLAVSEVLDAQMSRAKAERHRCGRELGKAEEKLRLAGLGK